MPLLDIRISLARGSRADHAEDDINLPKRAALKVEYAPPEWQTWAEAQHGVADPSDFSSPLNTTISGSIPPDPLVEYVSLNISPCMRKLLTSIKHYSCARPGINL
jgi:hypothetical protein